MLLPTLLNVELALPPRVVIAAMHTTMIRASITAYSTAVGPSSRFRKFTTHWGIRDNMPHFLSGLAKHAIHENIPWRELGFCDASREEGEKGINPCASFKLRAFGPNDEIGLFSGVPGHSVRMLYANMGSI